MKIGILFEEIMCVLTILVLTSPVFPQNPLISETPVGETTIQDARKAFQNYNPVLANELLEKIWVNPKETVKNKIRAGKYLAKLNANIFEDFEKARKIISQTVQLDPEDYDSYLIFSQIASEFDQHELALENAQLAIGHASMKQQKIVSYSSLGNILLNASLGQILNGPQVEQFADFNLDKNLIVTAIKQLERVIKEDPYQFELLKTKFALEILVGNGKKALETWQEYFNYSENSNSLITTTYSELKSSLDTWSGNELSIEKKKSLALALATARNFDLSMVVIKTIPENQIETDKELKEIVNYSKFLENVKALTASFYRKSAIRKSDPKEYRNTMVSNVKRLWATFSWDKMQKEFSLDNFEYEIDKRFGASIRIGNSNGWFSITWGHKVIEYSTTVEQYGKRGDIVFRSLDYLISNGFIGWYFDTTGNIGGWQSDNFVYQVRPKYLSRPYNAWVHVSDPAKVKAWEEMINKGMEKDVAMAGEDEISIFPGMLAQITFKARQGLLNDLIKEGFAAEELQQEFLSEYEKLTFENDILSHEGRHLIDHELAKQNTIKFTREELEFRGKLSEIAFAKYPFMALASIFSGGIDNSAHGQANKRLATALYDWMEENWRQVDGLDSSLPKAPQVYRLTDKQLITIIKSLDPLVLKSDRGEQQSPNLDTALSNYHLFIFSRSVTEAHSYTRCG